MHPSSASREFAYSPMRQGLVLVFRYLVLQEIVGSFVAASVQIRSIWLQRKRVLVSPRVFEQWHRTVSDICCSRYGKKSCCLPVGGQRSPPPPPAHKQCPHSDWSWSTEHSCCVPHRPVVDTHTPECDKNWRWSQDTSCCEQSSEPSTPGPSSCKKTEFWWVLFILRQMGYGCLIIDRVGVGSMRRNAVSQSAASLPVQTHLRGSNAHRKLGLGTTSIVAVHLTNLR